MREKAPAKALSTAAEPSLVLDSLPAGGTEPHSVLFIPAQGPGQAPGHSDLGDGY